MGQGWARDGTGMGQGWDRDGTGMGQDRDGGTGRDGELDNLGTLLLISLLITSFILLVLLCFK